MLQEMYKINYLRHINDDNPDGIESSIIFKSELRTENGGVWYMYFVDEKFPFGLVSIHLNDAKGYVIKSYWKESIPCDVNIEDLPFTVDRLTRQIFESVGVTEYQEEHIVTENGKEISEFYVQEEN